MRRELAETIALQALAWLAGNDELLPVFMGATGAGVSDLKTRATEPEFIGSVLDFIMMDDAWVMEFCEAHGLACDMPQQARSALPGGEMVNWT